MANSLISMIKGDSTLINNTEVLDGQVLFNTDEKTILLDDDNTRTKYCGADKSNKNLAPIENGNTATRGYSAGSYVVWKEQLYKVLTQINSGTAFVVGTNIVADTVGAELTQINNDLSGKQDKLTNPLTQSDIINNLTSTNTVKPLSAYQGKVLRDYMARKTNVTPTNSGKSTLLAYIKDVIFPMNIGVYSFSASGFSDLPRTDWGYTVIVISEGSSTTVIAYKHLSNSEYYLRSIYDNWITGWTLVGKFELLSASGTFDGSGLINTYISTTDYIIVGLLASDNTEIARYLPFRSGENWYIQGMKVGLDDINKPVTGVTGSFILVCMRM